MTLGEIKQIAEELEGAGYSADCNIDLVEGTDLNDARPNLTIAGWFQPRTGESNPVIVIN